MNHAVALKSKDSYGAEASQQSRSQGPDILRRVLLSPPVVAVAMGDAAAPSVSQPAGSGTSSDPPALPVRDDAVGGGSSMRHSVGDEAVLSLVIH